MKAKTFADLQKKRRADGWHYDYVSVPMAVNGIIRDFTTQYGPVIQCDCTLYPETDKAESVKVNMGGTALRDWLEETRDEGDFPFLAQINHVKPDKGNDYYAFGEIEEAEPAKK